MANKRHQRSNPGEGRGNTFPPNPLCPNIKLYQRAIQKTITQATCQLPYSHQKTVQPMGSTLVCYSDATTISPFKQRIGKWFEQKHPFTMERSKIKFNSTKKKPGNCERFQSKAKSLLPR